MKKPELKNKLLETGFHDMRLNQISRRMGLVMQPTFRYDLWICLEKWAGIILKEKLTEGKKAILRTSDLWNYSSKLKKLLDSQRGTKKLK